MLIENFILTRGFRNVFQAGQITGFQFKIKLPYYRGIFVSCIDDFVVKVDGQSYSLDNVSLKVGDRIFRWEQVDGAYDVFYKYGDPITVIVDKQGGLAIGPHMVECGLAIRKSYTPRVDPEGLYSFQSLRGIIIPRTAPDEFPPKDPRYSLQTETRELDLVI